MRILVLNAGSSSLKCSVFDTVPDRQLFKIELERLASVADGVRQLPALLAERGVQGIDAIAHRVVHGGEQLRDACVLDAEAIRAIEACSDLAPLHNPPALEGIRLGLEHWPGLPQVAVFDTAFHRGMPAHASTYAVPEEWRAAGLRRYGFHGSSHKYVMQRCAAALEAAPQDLRIISCHLGNGASVCAIERGVSVDCSMGASTLEGLVMGTRSGDVDPGLFGQLHRQLGLDIEQIEDGLFHRSGLAALSGCGSDLRDIERSAAAGSAAARLAIQVYAYRVHKYIGAFAAVMGGVDVIAFTGGIGEHSAAMRKRICERLEFLGLALDDAANEDARHPACGAVLSLHLPHSRVKLLVTEAREQWMIACEADRVLRAAQRAPATEPRIPIAVSNHHVHLSADAVDKLFGAGHRLQLLRPLSQPGQWVARETVDIAGPHGELQGLRVIGPCRAQTQIEIAQTDAFRIGVDAPLRLSGQLDNTPSVLIRGPAGSLRSQGVIVARRHLHVHPADAQALGLRGDESVDVEVHSEGRSLVFKDVAVRIGADFVTEMHLDTDEANAARIEHGGQGELLPVASAHARLHPGSARG
ncbi:MAG: acetate/propionate family kinase [Burkholderiaceae bacterium]